MGGGGGGGQLVAAVTYGDFVLRLCVYSHISRVELLDYAVWNLVRTWLWGDSR